VGNITFTIRAIALSARGIVSGVDTPRRATWGARGAGGEPGTNTKQAK
jgi:hypothetical protein